MDLNSIITGENNIKLKKYIYININNNTVLIHISNILDGTAGSQQDGHAFVFCSFSWI